MLCAGWGHAAACDCSREGQTRENTNFCLEKPGHSLRLDFRTHLAPNQGCLTPPDEVWQPPPLGGHTWLGGIDLGKAVVAQALCEGVEGGFGLRVRAVGTGAGAQSVPSPLVILQIHPGSTHSLWTCLITAGESGGVCRGVCRAVSRMSLP